MASPTRQTREGEAPQKSHKTAKMVIFIAMVVFAVLAGFGLLSRHQSEAALREQTEDAALPAVTLAPASGEPAAQSIELPGNVQAFYEAPIYARTDGYVHAWYTDIGSRVKAGQVLAVIETPDVDDQLRQAQADLGTAVANNDLAQTTARRWITLRKTNSVSQQDADDKIGDAAAKRAAVASAQANVARLRQMQEFNRVVAPFDGVVTARLTDIGDLITAGTSTVLFRVADTSKLRVYTQVPQTYVSSMKEGGEVNLTFTEYPGRSFPAKIARTSNALDPTTRTLMVELLLDNSNGTLLPGGYTEVHFSAKSSGNVVRVPVSAVLFRADGLHVVTIGSRWTEKPQNGDQQGEQRGKLALKTVTIGNDYGTALQITTGLSPGETIVTDPPDSATDGEIVKIDTSTAKSS